MSLPKTVLNEIHDITITPVRWTIASEEQVASRFQRVTAKMDCILPVTNRVVWFGGVTYVFEYGIGPYDYAPTWYVIVLSNHGVQRIANINSRLVGDLFNFSEFTF